VIASVPGTKSDRREAGRCGSVGSMATIEIDGGDLVVRLSRLERIGALRGDLRVPRKAVRGAHVAERPWDELRGVRAPGTGIPRVIMLGTTRGRGGSGFAAVYGNRRAVVVDLEGTRLRRIVVTTPDAQAIADRLSRKR